MLRKVEVLSGKYADVYETADRRKWIKSKIVLFAHVKIDDSFVNLSCFLKKGHRLTPYVGYVADDPEACVRNFKAILAETCGFKDFQQLLDHYHRDKLVLRTQSGLDHLPLS